MPHDPRQLRKDIKSQLAPAPSILHRAELSHEEKVAEMKFSAHQLKTRRLYQETRTLEEMAQDLCLAIEASPASEQHTKCSSLASQLRNELRAYQETRPLSNAEQSMIDAAWKRHSKPPSTRNAEAGHDETT